MADLNSLGGLHYEMMRRCYNQNSVAYKDYGAKGIEVCQEWHDRETFKTWAKNNGYIKGLRLNRKDSSKNYEPDNCFFGEKNKAKHGYSEMVKNRAKENKKKKLSLGLKKHIDSPVFGTYRSMLTRCYNKNHIKYKDYGERGITVCDEWKGKNGFYNFHKWSMENGWSNGLSIDRIDNEKGYSPENCRWANSFTQLRNRRNTRFFNCKGNKVLLSDIARENHVTYSLLYYRVVKKKMSIEDALNNIKKFIK